MIPDTGVGGIVWSIPRQVGKTFTIGLGLFRAELCRAALTPPKPDEPTGLGAVVEDVRGVRFVRTESAKGIHNPWSSALHHLLPDEIESLAYSDIAAVRVLSEGVTP